jgi:hypothetical protein
MQPEAMYRMVRIKGGMDEISPQQTAGPFKVPGFRCENPQLLLTSVHFVFLLPHWLVNTFMAPMLMLMRPLRFSFNPTFNSPANPFAQVNTS